MTLFTRRAFVSISLATVLAGFNPSSANAQVAKTLGLIKRASIKIYNWAYPHLEKAFIEAISAETAHYVIKKGTEFVQVILDVTSKAIENIKTAIYDATNQHLLQIAFAAISAGIVLTVAITGPGSIVAVPTEIIVEAASLPILLMFYHDDLTNFITGKAYEINYF